MKANQRFRPIPTSNLALSLAGAIGLTCVSLVQAVPPDVTENYNIETIQLPADALDSWGMWLNESGTITLQYITSDSAELGWTALLGSGGWTDINVEGSLWCGGSPPSSSGRVGLTYAREDGVMHTAIYHKGTYTYLPDHPTYAYGINALNDHGILTGYAVGPDGFMHGLLFNHSLNLFEVFDPPFDQDIWYTVALGINNAGINVGYTAGPDYLHGYVHDGQAFSKIVVPDAQDYVAPSSINNRGEIAGGYIDLDWTIRGFLLSKGEYFVFFVPGSEVTIIDTINDRGQLSGRYSKVVDEEVRVYGFVATPKGNN